MVAGDIEESNGGWISKRKVHRREGSKVRFELLWGEKEASLERG